jgi:heme/copper-type cytochrome/quinol oxidase subunit 2
MAGFAIFMTVIMLGVVGIVIAFVVSVRCEIAITSAIR